MCEEQNISYIKIKSPISRKWKNTAREGIQRRRAARMKEVKHRPLYNLCLTAGTHVKQPHISFSPIYSVYSPLRLGLGSDLLDYGITFEIITLPSRRPPYEYRFENMAHAATGFINSVPQEIVKLFLRNVSSERFVVLLPSFLICRRWYRMCLRIAWPDVVLTKSNLHSYADAAKNNPNTNLIRSLTLTFILKPGGRASNIGERLLNLYAEYLTALQELGDVLCQMPNSKTFSIIMMNEQIGHWVEGNPSPSDALFQVLNGLS